MPPLQEYDLISMALKGDQHAFSQLMQRHKGALLTYIQHQFSIVNDAEDLLMVVFDRAFSKLAQFNPKYSFATWLYAIADHACIDFIRKQKTNPHLSRHLFEAYESNPANHIFAPSDPESEMIASQEEALILYYIERLKPIYREPARLRFLRDYAYEEIARELSIPEGTVKIRIHRAKEILSKWITTS